MGGSVVPPYRPSNGRQAPVVKREGTVITVPSGSLAPRLAVIVHIGGSRESEPEFGRRSPRQVAPYEFIPSHRYHCR